MDTLAAVLARCREREGTALDAPERTTPYSYGEFAENAWKAGNLLRHYGVRRGSRVALVVGPKAPGSGDTVGRLGAAVDPLLALFGAASLGATVDVTPTSPVAARALVAPDAWLDRYEGDPGCSLIAYGGPPDRPEVAHFERERWSENPAEPPDTVEPDDPVLRVDDREYTHATVLEAATTLVEEYGLEPGDVVAVDALLTSAGAVVAGVVAPIVAGAIIRPIPAAGTAAGADAVYTVREDGEIGSSDAGGGDVLAPSTVIE